MKTNKYLLYLSLLIMIIISTASLKAQEELSINTIFEKYGKQKGSTMVVLSGKALHEHKLDKYKGITLKSDIYIINEIQLCLETDKKKATQIKEVISDGIITSGFYQLSEKSNLINRYILFKIGNDGTATLIYLEGGTESEELVTRLFIKKN